MIIAIIITIFYLIPFIMLRTAGKIDASKDFSLFFALCIIFPACYLGCIYVFMKNMDTYSYMIVKNEINAIFN